MTEKRPHPHFNDRGTLDWKTSFKDAFAAAQPGKKRLFIEFGRELCGQCRSLVQAVVPRPDIAPLLQEHFIALASDCDDPEPEVEELAQHIPDAMMLPFVILADHKGQFLEGWSGSVPPDVLKKMLERALA